MEKLLSGKDGGSRADGSPDARFSHRPGVPYEGSEPYIFVSYRHNDSLRVFPFVERLMGAGYRVWYDERIECGTEWRAIIQNRIENCAVFFSFLSEEYCESRECRREISVADADGKTIIPIYLEDAKLAHGLKMILTGLQGLLVFERPDDDDDALFERLIAISGSLENCKSGNSASGKGTKSQPAPPSKKPKVAMPTPKPTTNAQGLQIATFEMLRARDMTALEIAERLVENDRKLYPMEGEENEGTPELWAEYLASFPETFRYVINEAGEIVGNWSFLAVSEEKHGELLKSGELLESTFSPDDTEFLLFEGDYVGYLLNLSLNEGYATQANYDLLFDSFAQQLTEFARSGIFFKEWYINVFRRDHAAMYKRLGFEFLCKNKEVGDLYVKRVSTLGGERAFKQNDELRDLYREHYGDQI